MKELSVSIILFVLINILPATHSSAQFSYPTQKQTKQFLERVLVIELYSADERLLSRYKLKSPEKIPSYKRRITEKNDSIKEIFRKHWKINKKITFRERGEIEKIVKLNDTRFAILVYGHSIQAKGTEIVDHWDEFSGYTFAVYLPELADGWDKEYIDKINVLADRAGTKSGKTEVEKGTYIFKISFMNDKLSMNNIIFMIEQFNYHIPRALEFGKESNLYRKYFWIPKFLHGNVEKLKKDTLVLSPELSGISQSEITKYYRYPVKIMSEKEINKIISERKKNYAYVIPVWDDITMNFTYMIVEASTHRVLAFKLNIQKFEKPIFQTINEWVSGNTLLQPKDIIR